MAKEECRLCHKIVKGPLHSKDGVCVCYDCAKIIASNANIKMINFSAYLWSFNELEQMYNQSSQATSLATEQVHRRENFNKKIETLEASGVKFNHYHKSIILPKPNLLRLDLYDTYSYNDIIKYEYFEDAKLITEGTVGKAIIGGLLFGTVGAVIGSNGAKTTNCKVEKQEVHITIRIPGSSDIKIYKVDVADTFEYSKEKAEKLILLLQEAIDLVKPQVKDTASNSGKEVTNKEDIPSQIRKFKSLMDDGIISKEEFEIKKKQLLNL